VTSEEKLSSRVRSQEPGVLTSNFNLRNRAEVTPHPHNKQNVGPPASTSSTVPPPRRQKGRIAREREARPPTAITGF